MMVRKIRERGEGGVGGEALHYPIMHYPIMHYRSCRKIQPTQLRTTVCWKEKSG